MICQGCWILLPCRCSGWLSSAIFLSHQLPTEVVGYALLFPLVPLFLRSPTFSSGFLVLGICQCLLLWATAPCWLLSSVSNSPPRPLIRSCVTWFAPSGSRPPSGCCVLQPGTSLRCSGFLICLCSNLSSRLLFVI